jgi:hypothetical protein
MVKPKTTLFLVLLGACQDGPNPETLVDDLQVIAAVAEPPTVAEDTPWTLTVHVADPQTRGAQVLVWSCDPEGVCDTQLLPPEDEIASTELVGLGGTSMWLLACAPDICDLTDVPTADLLNPLDWMTRLPFDGVSLALREVRLADPELAVPATNPELAKVPADDWSSNMAPGDSTDLVFSAPGAARAWGYSTDGGFRTPVEDIASDGSVTLTWIAPETEVEARLYVVFEDDDGGTTVWRGDTSPG